MPFRLIVSIQGRHVIGGVSTKHTTTVDSNIFRPVADNMVTTGTVNRRKYRVVCDGKGSLHYRLIDDTIKTLERLAKLKKTS